MTIYRPQRPAIDSELELYTFQDAVDHLTDAFGVTSVSGSTERRLLRAVMDAYRDIPLAHNWNYFRRRGQIRTVASQSTGTIAYDHTGGSSERLITLSGATFPTDARNYRIIISDVHYDIEEYKSSTTVTLTETSNPGADVAAATTYTLYRSQYPMPPNYQRGTRLVDLANSNFPQYKDAEQGLMYLSAQDTPIDNPRLYTIGNGGNDYSGMVVEFFPPPSSARTYDFQYIATPRPIKTYGTDAQYTTGTISVSGTTVTGSGTTFASRMIGCVMRFTTSTTTAPSGRVGSADTWLPFDEQAIVTAVGSATSITIDRTLSGTYSGCKYSIGDPLDVEPQVMLTPLLFLSEAYFERLRNQAKEDNSVGRMRKYMEMLRNAIAADFRPEHIVPEVDWVFAPTTSLAEANYS